jgi:hypothetical protein
MNTLNILLSDGKLYTKEIPNSDSSTHYSLWMIANYHIDIKDIQSIWYQPSSYNITLEALELKV